MILLNIGGKNIKLTVNERILLHLRRYYTAQKEVEAPFAVTQKGIADAIDIRVTHVPRSVKKLDEEGLIYESVMHIEGLDKRRKAYFLTDKGMYQANEIKRNLEGRTVPFKDQNGKVRDVKISEIENLTGIKLDVLDLIKLIDKEGLLYQKSIESLVKKTVSDEKKDIKIFDFPHKVPIIKDFVDRKEEREILLGWIKDQDITLISINGTTGIGKTSLLADVAFKLKDKMNIFWFGFGKGEGLNEMMGHLSEFFTRINRGELKAVLRGKDRGLGELLKGTLTALSSTNAILIIDALDDSDDTSKKFVYLLSQHLDEFIGSKIIILHRDQAKRYVKETMDSKHFKSLYLRGLDKKSCKAILGLKRLEKDEFERIFKLTEGNPLALKLIKSEDVGELEKSGKYTKDELTLIRYLKSLDKIEK